LLVCNTCHGGNGVPHNAATPIIWGQQENYLIKQLHDFHGDARNSEVMRWMATALTQPELQAAATYFAKKSWPAKSASVAGGASPPAMLAVCQACHQQNFVGGLPAPRLAGQKYEYLVEAMRDYAQGKRTNNAEMMRMMEAISADERDAIARYLSGL
jgi:cytochrome c553